MSKRFKTLQARIPDPVPDEPHRLRPPFTACWPHAAELPPPSAPIPVLISIFPTSRPSMYPAEKLMAEKTTTTPALRTHVMTVGLFVAAVSYNVPRRFFLEADGCPELDRRFLGAGVVGTGLGSGCLRGPAVMFVSAGSSSSLSPSPIATDSGTSRNEDGCCREGPAGCCGSDFGRPRAAAAQDNNVERLARRAAS